MCILYVFNSRDAAPKAYRQTLPVHASRSGNAGSPRAGPGSLSVCRCARRGCPQMCIRDRPCTSSPLRDNFTIAHELGHLFLHKTEESKEFHRSGEPKTEEVEANIFAAEFLMPEDEFKNKAKEFNNSERMLASYFGVSPAAALVRMAVLNIDKN